MSLNWTENAALDYGSTMIRLTAMRAYISAPDRYSEIADVIEHALADLNRILQTLKSEGRSGDCPAGWCPDGDEGCDWCVGNNGNGDNGSEASAEN